MRMSICFIILVLVALLASGVTGDVTRSSDHHQLQKPVNVSSSWDLLESIANSISSRIDMTSRISFSDIPSYSLWDSYAGSLRSYRPTGVKIMNEMLTDKQYVKSRIQMVGSILLGPEKSWSTLYSPREHYWVDAKLQQCLYSSMTLFAKHCGFRSQYRVKHRLPFKNLCDHVSDRTKIEEAIIVACGSKKVKAHVVNLRNPSLEVTPPPLDGSEEYCERIAVDGVSRLNFGSAAKVYRVLLKATTMSSYKWYKRTQVCFHGSPSLGLCHCEKNDWRTSEDGVWSFVMSPYMQGILDIKYNSTIGDSLSISIEEVLQPWRYVFLIVGIALFFLAPAIEKYILSMVVADVKAHSINWMTRVIALSCIFQSSKDTRFALAVVICFLEIYGNRRLIKDPSKFMKFKFCHWSGEETLEVSGPWSGQDMPKFKGSGFPRHQGHLTAKLVVRWNVKSLARGNKSRHNVFLKLARDKD